MDQHLLELPDSARKRIVDRSKGYSEPRSEPEASVWVPVAVCFEIVRGGVPVSNNGDPNADPYLSLRCWRPPATHDHSRNAENAEFGSTGP